MTLHIISKNCLSTLQEVKAIARADDQQSAIVLIESGTYLLSAIQTSDHLPTYVLKDHTIARGIYSAIPDSINIIEYNGFVKLVESHNNTISW